MIRRYTTPGQGGDKTPSRLAQMIEELKMYFLDGLHFKAHTPLENALYLLNVIIWSVAFINVIIIVVMLISGLLEGILPILLFLMLLLLIYQPEISDFLHRQQDSGIDHAAILKIGTVRVLHSPSSDMFHLNTNPVEKDIEVIQTVDQNWEISLHAPNAEIEQDYFLPVFTRQLEQECSNLVNGAAYPITPIRVSRSDKYHRDITITVKIGQLSNGCKTASEHVENKVPVGLYQKFLKMDLYLPVLWDYTKNAHMLIIGRTGSGKTHCLKKILAQIAEQENSKLMICDFKGDDDFGFLEGSENFYKYEQVFNGIEAFASLLEQRQNGADKTQHVFCIIDEYAAALTSCDKKTAEKLKQTVERILMLGRSFNLHLIISQQRPDAAYFGSSRDNFSCVIGCGILSKETVNMLFTDFKDSIDMNKPIGQASCILSGDFIDLNIPFQTDIDRLNAKILFAVQRTLP